MAESTRPARNRKPASTKEAPASAPKKAAKPASAKAAKPAALEPSADGRQRFGVVLEHARDTKTYSVFEPPASSGCVGSFYAPLGTEEVKVVLIGSASAAE